MKRVVFGLVPFLLYAATAAAQFTFVLTERQGGKMSTAKGFEDGAKFRLELQDSQTADSPEGLYVISTDSGHTVYMVNSKVKEFARVDTKTLVAEAAEKLKALMKQSGLEIESPKVETMLTEPGGTVDGHPTVHHKLRISYSMHYVKTDVRHPYMEYQDLWMASDIEQPGATDLLVYFRPSGDARIDDAWAQELAKIPGFPLRQTTLRTEVDEEGNSTVLRISREITNVRTEPVPASLFELPKDYKERTGHGTEVH